MSKPMTTREDLISEFTDIIDDLQSEEASADTIAEALVEYAETNFSEVKEALEPTG